MSYFSDQDFFDLDVRSKFVALTRIEGRIADLVSELSEIQRSLHELAAPLACTCPRSDCKAHPTGECMCETCRKRAEAQAEPDRAPITGQAAREHLDAMVAPGVQERIAARLDLDAAESPYCSRCGMVKQGAICQSISCAAYGQGGRPENRRDLPSSTRCPQLQTPDWPAPIRLLVHALCNYGGYKGEQRARELGYGGLVSSLYPEDPTP